MHKKLQVAAAALRVKCKTLHPVRVMITNKVIRRHSGDSYLHGRHFEVRILPNLKIDEQLELLVHEWAHCVVWKVPEELEGDHGPLWGVAYAAAYRAVFED